MFPWVLPLPYRSFSDLGGPTYQLLIIVPEQLEFCLGNILLCQGIQGSFQISLLLEYVYPGLCRGTWFTWAWALYKITNMGLFSFSTYRLLVRTALSIEERFSFSIEYFWLLCQRSSMWFYFWIFYSIPLFNLTVSVSIPHSFYPYSSVLLLEVRDAGSSWSYFIVKNCFWISIFPQMNLRFAFSKSIEKCVGIFMVIALNL